MNQKAFENRYSQRLSSYQRILLAVTLGLIALTSPVVAQEYPPASGAESSPAVATIFSEESLDARHMIEGVAQGLGTPWGLAFLPGNHLLITSRAGEIHLFDVTSSRLIKVIDGPDAWQYGQGGLLDIAVPPQWRSGDWVYMTYTKQQGRKGATALARAKLALPSSGAEEVQFKQFNDVLVTKSNIRSGRHFGSRIAFDDQGHIFFSVGDRGERPWSQDLSNHAGSILRLKLDGSVPADNPFVGQPGALPQIWSYGHRNPQGLVIDRVNQRIWAIEHGPRGGDEINLVQRGMNYGWPVISYGKEYALPFSVGEGTHRAGMQQPHKVYIPSIAPSSLLLYSGKAFPEWQGQLFAGSLKLQHINRIELDDQGNAVKEVRMLGEYQKRIRALAEDENGWIYFSTDSGEVARMRPRP